MELGIRSSWRPSDPPEGFVPHGQSRLSDIAVTDVQIHPTAPYARLRYSIDGQQELTEWMEIIEDQEGDPYVQDDRTGKTCYLSEFEDILGNYIAKLPMPGRDGSGTLSTRTLLCHQHNHFTFTCLPAAIAYPLTSPGEST